MPGATADATAISTSRVHVQPHPVFRRQGDDLCVVMPIGVHEAVLGARVDVPSLEGPVKLRIPPGTQAGQRFRLRDRGVPAANGGRGDLLIEVRIVLPAVVDERGERTDARVRKV